MKFCNWLSVCASVYVPKLISRYRPHINVYDAITDRVETSIASNNKNENDNYLQQQHTQTK